MDYNRMVYRDMKKVSFHSSQDFQRRGAAEPNANYGDPGKDQ